MFDYHDSRRQSIAVKVTHVIGKTTTFTGGHMPKYNCDFFTLLFISSPMSLAASWAYKTIPFHYSGASDYQHVQSDQLNKIVKSICETSTLVLRSGIMCFCE